MADFIALRMTPVGRFEVECMECGNLFWFTPSELDRASACPHCEGWWTFAGPMHASDGMHASPYLGLGDDDGDPC